MYQSLYVPLDGSVASEHALPFAVSLARRSKANIRLAEVHLPALGLEEHVMAVSLQLEKEARGHERRHLDEIAARLHSEHSLDAKAAVLEIPILGSLLADIEKHKPDLIVMTTHGRGPFSRFWLGSIADGLIRHASVPILLLRPQPGVADFHREPECRRMLVLLDGSSLAEQIIPHAIEMARFKNAECTLMQLIEPVMPLLFYPAASEGRSEIDHEILTQMYEAQQQRATVADSYLAKVAKGLAAQGVPVKTMVVANQPIASAILQELETGNFDLVALATHGHGGVRRMIVGSVADKVIRSANCPVLVLHPRETNK
jgi:nucleotide-binding universal stress UspA family protein